MERKKKIGIGLPIYKSVEPEVAFDYMRMAFHFGRRMQDYDFFPIMKTKSEQFRARNAIVETALQIGIDYLLFLDDDQVFDWRDYPTWDSYNFLEKLLSHQKPIVGALYFHRGGNYSPVLMKKVEREGKIDSYRFLKDNEITGGLQKVDVQGGGIMLIDMKIFDKVKPPYFEPEMQSEEMGGNKYGTDIQLCRKAYDAGYDVWCDTSIVVGHLRNQREIITPYNRTQYILSEQSKQGHLEDWMIQEWLREYQKDAVKYTGMDLQTIFETAGQYNDKHFHEFHKFDNKEDYYKSLGTDQVCRQVWFHSRPEMHNQATMILNYFGSRKTYGLDYGCGSAPIGYALLKKGHKVDFIDLDGAGGYEFLKWRVKENDFEERAGWKLQGPYQWVILMDAIEHWVDWETILDRICGSMDRNASLITNFFGLNDFMNPEHITMDKQAVADFLVSRGVFPVTESVWKKDAGKAVGPMNIRNVKEN